MPRPVSIITVSYDTLFFVRLLVEKVREFTCDRPYEIIVVDRGSSDGTMEWCARQPDVRIISVPQIGASHEHGEAAERGVQEARYDIVALMDSDAHPITAQWLECTADRLDENTRLAGTSFLGNHRGNRFGWYVHPSFMVFQKEDLGADIVLRKVRGDDTDTGEEATIRLLEKGKAIGALPLESCPTLSADHPHSAYRHFSFGHPHFPTIGAGVFHAWYGTRALKDTEVVEAETAGTVDLENYQRPLIAMLREMYQLDY